MSTESPEFGLIVVGDEILAGRRRDGHMGAVIERLTERGLELAWCRFVGDDRARLVHALRDTLAGEAIVFCCGGIGATPDDATRQAAAEAAGVGLERHPEAYTIVHRRFGPERLTEHRLRMIDFPQGADLIPNPVNEIPGFRLDRHYFVPGFPNMAWPMIEWALDTRHGDLVRPPSVSHAIQVSTPESDLVPLLETLGAAHPGVRISSLPDMRDDGYRVELGVHGPAPAARAALTALEQALDEARIPRVEPDGD